MKNQELKMTYAVSKDGKNFVELDKSIFDDILKGSMLVKALDIAKDERVDFDILENLETIQECLLIDAYEELNNSGECFGKDIQFIMGLKEEEND